MWRILVPLKYLSIDHPEKRKFDLYLPMLLTILFALPLLSAQFRADILSGVLPALERISNLLGVLTGFFIASLAAVATFGKSEMDGPMPGEPLKLEYKVNRESFSENLTRRRFLSFLFGYLAFLSLSLFVVGYVYYALDQYMIARWLKDLRETLFIFFWVAYTFWLSNVLSNTFLGLYYLTDRIHRPSGAVTWNERTGEETSDGADSAAASVEPDR